MKKSFDFYIIDENGKMRNTVMYYCTEEERAEFFKRYRISVQVAYPGSTAGWMEGKRKK